MSLFASYTREQLRQTYADAWRKHLQRAPLSPLEALIADVIALHPEYHALMRDPDELLAHAPSGGPGGGASPAENPFLHMGLHLAVREQVAIDRPPGVSELHRLLQVERGHAHVAEHALMDALAETLWEAQRDGRPPDERHYLALARRGIKR